MVTRQRIIHLGESKLERVYLGKGWNSLMQIGTRGWPTESPGQLLNMQHPGSGWSYLKSQILGR